MDKELYAQFERICPDFAPYHFLKTDLFKGKIKGGYNVYYKKGTDDTEGMITGMKNVDKFDLHQFPQNFVTYGSFNQSLVERGWTGDVLLQVLKQIESKINECRPT